MFKIIDSLGEIFTVDYFVFNDGSVQVNIDDVERISKQVFIMANLQTPTDQIALFMVVDILRRNSHGVEINLIVPFMPYGRQDSAFYTGQANAMKVWARMINTLQLNQVIVVDPHSSAIEHIDNLHVINSNEFINSVHSEWGSLVNSDITLVSPDAGANKKCHKIAKSFGVTKMVRADKARDLRTGKITETKVYGKVEGETCVIVDDIADGGATFVFLGEKLKAMGASKVILIVTHGLFTKGLSVFEGIIDEIYTSNSWIHEDESFKEGYTGVFKSLELIKYGK